MLRDRRLSVILWAIVAFAVGLVGRTAWVQFWQASTWDALATREHYARTTIGAPRGDIRDVTGVSLAESEVRVRLAVAPGEVDERKALARALSRLGVDQATVRRTVDVKRKWVPIGRTFIPSDARAVMALHGVHAEEVAERAYMPSEGLRRIVGRTDAAGAGADGIELLLDSLLRGERGTAAPLVGPHGERYESQDMLTDPPRPGHSVTLTINSVLQDICDRAIDDAAARFDASGGDIVVLDPMSGEIRCLASRRPGAAATSSPALTEPFEPGSTLKPFLVGHLLEAHEARTDEVIETFNGVYRTFGRTITDLHKAPRLSLADVVRYSSNVGIVRFTERLTRGEMYQTLRDYGFGTPTGISYPSEASGTLREPRSWSLQSQASIAIGYEITVTPVQLATAYAAIANGGLLMSPALISEIRDADGHVLYEHHPRVVRRVLQAETARVLRGILASVVDSGTATDASLSAYSLGGKSGTARRTVNGRYGTGSYTSSFVGVFPANDPQYVVLVKLDNPHGVFYGGKAAAPVAKAIIESAIAARDAALDRSGLAMARAGYVPPATGKRSGVFVSTGTLPRDARSATAGARFSAADSLHDPAPLPPIEVNLAARALKDSTAAAEEVTVPDVSDLPLRLAVRVLHGAGLRVVLVQGASGLSPASGSTVPRRSLVRLGAS